jgi:hypothetical protein
VRLQARHPLRYSPPHAPHLKINRPPSAPTARSGSARGPCALRREGAATAARGGGGGGLHVRTVRGRAGAEQEVHFDQAQRLD